MVAVERRYPVKLLVVAGMGEILKLGSEICAIKLP
jgi:hypothetical protein